jgi:minor histocompatibility antigen H13
MNNTGAMSSSFSSFAGESLVLQTIGRWGHTIYAERELWQMYIHLVLSAIFPIYIGAHASLRRPPSAEMPKKKEGDEDDDDELEVEQVVEGLTPSDAIMFPVMAGITLGGLYLVIKWLKDPKILNKILNWYFSGNFQIYILIQDFLVL